MKFRILNALLLVLCILTVTLSNAQIVSNERESSVGDYQVTPKHKLDDVEEELEERIERGDLLNPIGASAYDTYKIYVEKHPSDHSLQRKLKRCLVAALADASDKALTVYFDEGGAFILKYMSYVKGIKRNEPVDRYYFVAADLLGEDHFLYGSLKSKGYFIEALKFRYIEEKEPEAVKEKLEKSIALDPDASYTYNELGQIYFDEENYRQACENYNHAIKLNAYWEIPQEKLKMAKEALVLIRSKNKKG